MAKKALFGVLILTAIGACADPGPTRDAESQVNLDPLMTDSLESQNEGQGRLSQSRAQATAGTEHAVAPRPSQKALTPPAPAPKASIPAPVLTPTPTPPAPPAPAPPKPYAELFSFDSAVLSEAAERSVAADVAKAESSGVIDFSITGHADSAGSESYNLELSLRRASAVRDALMARGVKSNGISVAGRGEAEPAVPTDDGVREPANRRVEITFL